MVEGIALAYASEKNSFLRASQDLRENRLCVIPASISTVYILFYYTFNVNAVKLCMNKW